MRVPLIFFLALITALPIFSQENELLEISEADRLSYYDTETHRTVYPILGISKTKGDSVFYQNNLIFCKEALNKKESVFFEVFNNSILIACYRPEGQLGVNDPVFIKRDFLYMVGLKQPGRIYLVNLEGKRLVKNKSTFNLLKSAGEDVNSIVDIDLSNKRIVIEGSGGSIDTLSILDMTKR